jgi:hypothetical protein
MRYIDYDLNIDESGIKLDSEIRISDDFGWQEGDYFELVTAEDGVRLVKVDPLVAFVKGYAVNNINGQNKREN